MTPSQMIKYKRNSRRLTNIVSELITRYDTLDNSSFFDHSCRDYVLEGLKEYIKYHVDEIASWKDVDTDYIYIAHLFLVRYCDGSLHNNRDNSFLLSRQYTYSSYRNLLKKCLDWAQANGYLTEEERNEYHV